MDDVFGSYILDSRPSSEFYYEAAKNKLMNLELSSGGAPNITITAPGDGLAGDAGGVGRQGRVLRLSGCVDLDSKLTVSASRGYSTVLLTVDPGWLCWCYSTVHLQKKDC